MKFGNFVYEEVSKAASERKAWGRGIGNGEEDLR